MKELWGNPMNPRHREKIQTPGQWHRPVLQQDDRRKFPQTKGMYTHTDTPNRQDKNLLVPYGR